MSDIPDDLDQLGGPFGAEALDAFDRSENTPVPQRIEDLRPVFSQNIDFLVNLSLGSSYCQAQAKIFFEDLGFFIAQLLDRNAPLEVRRMLYSLVEEKVDVSHEASLDFLALVHSMIFGNLLPSSSFDNGGWSPEIAVFLTKCSFYTGDLFLIDDLTNYASLEYEYVLPRPASASSIRAAAKAYLRVPMSYSLHDLVPGARTTIPVDGMKIVIEDTKAALLSALAGVPKVEVIEVFEPTPLADAVVAFGGDLMRQIRQESEVKRLVSSGRVGRVAVEL